MPSTAQQARSCTPWRWSASLKQKGEEKRLWSDSHLIDRVVEQDGFCTYTFQRCKILGHGLRWKWFWGQHLRGRLEP